MNDGPLAVSNNSPFVCAVTPGFDREGRPQITIVVKGTFQVESGRCRAAPADQQIPIVHAPVHHGDPATSSLRYESDLVSAKPGTDVVLVGQAWSLKPTTGVMVKVRAGPLSARLRVSGDRHWRKGWFGWNASTPQPFERMPLVYERAYGGSDLDAPPGPKAGDMRNPIGVGFRRPAVDGDQVRNALPNLEHPEHPLRSPGDRSAMPVGVGFISPAWMPRLGHAGTYDDAWRSSRAPFLPDDFDPRFLLAASPGLSATTHFLGGEAICVENAGPDAVWEFALPTGAPAVAMRMTGNRRLVPALALDTVLLEPDQSHAVLTWRGVATCGRHWMEVERITVAVGDVA